VLTFVPLNDRLLVRRKEEVEEQIGSILVPEVAKEKPAEGLVLAAGPGRVLDNGTRIPLSVRVGETVLFGKYAGTDVKVGAEVLFILREDEILGVMRTARVSLWQRIGTLLTPDFPDAPPLEPQA